LLRRAAGARVLERSRGGRDRGRCVADRIDADRQHFDVLTLRPEPAKGLVQV